MVTSPAASKRSPRVVERRRADVYDRDREQHPGGDREQPRCVERAQPDQVGDPHQRQEQRALAREDVAEGQLAARIARADDANTPSSNTSERVAKNAGQPERTATTARIERVEHASCVDAVRAAPAGGTGGASVVSTRLQVGHRIERSSVHGASRGRTRRSPAVRSPSVGILRDGRKSKALAKHIFVTGGVASSLGKGLTASSLGRLLKSRGLRVTMQKLDPYINVDPGTMNPFQHGEVFVTDDGGETDLDLGHYERFVDVPLTRNPTRPPARSTRTCSPRSGAATTSARPCR